MKHIVMTGGTSGLGLEASKKLLTQKDLILILGYRNSGVEEAVNLPLDLASLAEVKNFAEETAEALKGESIDVLICNAGVNFPSNNKCTEDGFEMNFGVNYLSHFYLIQLLKPSFGQHVKIILTTSGTIDPKKETLAAAPKHVRINWLAYPELDETLSDDNVSKGKRAYASSKICSLFIAMQINNLDNSWEGITYDPGLTPGTSLLRHADKDLKDLAKQLTNNEELRQKKFPKSNSVIDAGQTLADTALGNIQSPEGKYIALRGGKVKYITPPGLARNKSLPEKVWNSTADLLEDM